MRPVQLQLGLPDSCSARDVDLELWRDRLRRHLARSRSPYEILGVPHDVVDAELERAFRAWALWVHPDRRTGDADTFVRFRAAFDLLHDPERRLALDFELGQPVALSDVLYVPLRVAVRGGAVVWHRFTVHVPEGTLPGDVVCLRGCGPGHPAGDVLLEVQLEPDGSWHLDGLNLCASLPVTWYEAYRGAALSLETPWGARTLPLQPPVEDGQVVELEGEGVRRGGARGSLVVRLHLVPPTGGDLALQGILLRLQGQDRPREALEAAWRT